MEGQSSYITSYTLSILFVFWFRCCPTRAMWDRCRQVIREPADRHIYVANEYVESFAYVVLGYRTLYAKKCGKGLYYKTSDIPYLFEHNGKQLTIILLLFPSLFPVRYICSVPTHMLFLSACDGSYCENSQHRAAFGCVAINALDLDIEWL